VNYPEIPVIALQAPNVFRNGLYTLSLSRVLSSMFYKFGVISGVLIFQKRIFKMYYTLKKEKELKLTSLLPILHHKQSMSPFL
jgi:hypothetical protein